jgi:HAMP domain-containing protein
MKGFHPKRIYTCSSILYKILILVTVLCGIVMIYSFSRLYLGWSDYQQAKELKTIKNITSPFTDALKNFMFERGRTNVVLSANGPISKENRSFIDERRAASDESFEAGFSIMKGKYPEEAEVFRKEYDKIKTLRIKMDEEMQKSIIQRDPDGRTVWYTNCTSYINLVSATLKKIGGRPLNNNLITHYNELIIDTLRFRSIVGNESSIFTSAITGRKTISDDEYAALLFMRGESKQIWSDMENEIEMIGSDNLIEAAETVKDRYYRQFRTNQDKLLELVLKGQIYEGADKGIANLSVPALDSILLLADEAIQEIDIENQKNMKNGYRSFIKGLLQLLAGILIIIFIPAYLKTRLIQPLDNIVELIESLSIGKIDINIPFIQRNDEVGKLANGVEMLQKSIKEEQTLKLELQQAIIKLEDLSIKDPLTELYNRRYIIERINELETRYKRNKSLFSIIISDIDYFKNINDRYGRFSTQSRVKDPFIPGY